jgi:hypothetical protein
MGVKLSFPTQQGEKKKQSKHAWEQGADLKGHKRRLKKNA